MSTRKNVGQILIDKAKQINPNYAADGFNDMGEALSIILENMNQGSTGGGGGSDIFEVSIPSNEQTMKMYTSTDGNNDNMITVVTADFDDNTVEKLEDDSTNAVLAKVGHETFVLNKTSAGYGTATCKFMPDDNLVMMTTCGLYSDDDNEKIWRFVMTMTVKSVQPAAM